MNPFFPVHPVVGAMAMVWWDLYIMMFVPPHLHAYVDDMKRKRRITPQTHEE